MIERITFPDWIKVERREILPTVALHDFDSHWNYGVADTGDGNLIRNAFAYLVARRLQWKFGREVIAAFSGLDDPTAISDSDSEEIAAFEADCYRGCSLTKAEGDEIQARRRSYRATYLEQWRIKQGRVQA